MNQKLGYILSTYQIQRFNDKSQQNTLHPIFQSYTHKKLQSYKLSSTAMSAATAAFPCIKITKSTCTSSSSSSCTPTLFRFSATKHSILTIRSSQADGPIRRPVATPPARPTPPSPSSAPPPKPVAVSPPVVENGKKSVVTMEFQRQKAKELQEYFKKKKLEEANQGPFFGFLAKNEISNGR